MNMYIFIIISLIINITIHEFAHAFVAYKLGDNTPKIQKRLSLNPFRHLDPFGTIMFFVARIGWGKPVEYNPENLKNPVRDGALISIAGPISNLILGLFSAFMIVNFDLSYDTKNIIINFAYISIALAVFNILPIAPLDGSHLVEVFLYKKPKLLFLFHKYTPFFLMIIIFVEFIFNIPIISWIITPLIEIIWTMMLFIS